MNSGERQAIRSDPRFAAARSVLGEWAGLDSAAAQVFAGSVLAGVSPLGLARELLDEATALAAERLVIDAAAASLKPALSEAIDDAGKEFDASDDEDDGLPD